MCEREREVDISTWDMGILQLCVFLILVTGHGGGIMEGAQGKRKGRRRLLESLDEGGGREGEGKELKILT